MLAILFLDNSNSSRHGNSGILERSSIKFFDKSSFLRQGMFNKPEKFVILFSAKVNSVKQSKLPRPSQSSSMFLRSSSLVRVGWPTNPTQELILFWFKIIEQRRACGMLVSWTILFLDKSIFFKYCKVYDCSCKNSMLLIRLP